jgi:DNA-directed RNA polymerase subunit beta'
MAVHLPLSFETQLECRVLMLSSNNILHPASGQPIAVPSQDMVLGLYYLSKPRPNRLGEGMRFYDEDEVVRAYENKAVDLNAWVYIRLNPGRKIYRASFEKDVLVLDEQGVERIAKAGEKLEFATLLEVANLKTTVGRIFLNRIIPNDIGYANDTFSKKVISRTVDDLYRRAGNRKAVGYLDALKDIGYFWATRAGSSVAIADMIIPPEKYEIVRKTDQDV